LPHSALWTTTRFANRSIADEIEKFAAALSTRITPRATICERVEQATRALLAAGVRADSATVAKRLGMTSRTLQRRLEDERTNFRALRDAVLWEAVEVLLSNPSLKIEAVALSAGFCDVGAFSKPFGVGRVTRRRITGKSRWHGRGARPLPWSNDGQRPETPVCGDGARLAVVERKAGG
jgi:AraC-like DNA-binding protein